MNPQGRSRLVALLVGAALLLGVGVQTDVFARRVTLLDARARSVEQHLSGPLDDIDPALSQIFAWRSLPGLAARIPADARVLLVSGALMPAQFHFYFQPRPFVFLQPLEPKHLQWAIEHRPQMAETLRQQFERLEGKGLRLTPERLQSELASADYLVLFLHPGPPPPGAQLELIARDEVAALYRVVHG